MLRDGSDPYGDLRHRIECRHGDVPGYPDLMGPRFFLFLSNRVQDSAPATDLPCFFEGFPPVSLCLHIRRVITQTYVMLHPLPPLGSDPRAPLSPPVRRV